MKKPNPTALGVFIVLGMALGVAGVLIFSSGRLFHPQLKNILYFNGSLKGLNPGAPVKFRGVTIGSVDEILIRHNQAREDFAMPVIISIDKKLAQSKSDQNLQLGSRARLEEQIRRGFRARLDAESLLTGVLYVSVDVLPNARPPVFHQLHPEFPEIPTVPSEIQQLLDNLGRVDLPGISVKLNSILGKADTGLSQLNIPQLGSGLTNLLGQANHFMASPDLTNTVIAARRALERAEALLGHVDRQVDPLAGNLNTTLSDAQKTMADLRTDLQHLGSLLEPESALQSDLSQALQQLANASQAVADLADFLKRNPDALIRGRKPPQEPP